MLLRFSLMLVVLSHIDFFLCLVFAQIDEKGPIAPRICMEKALERLNNLPEKQCLRTLDNQEVDLEEFFVKCLANGPYCNLYRKFYYWKNEVLETVSNFSGGRTRHKIRVYHNLFSMCCPHEVDPAKTHGDVVEFYDTDGEFMGMAVYSGKGLYFPLPYSGYSSKPRKMMRTRFFREED